MLRYCDVNYETEPNMESTYDENLEENKFFKTLRADYEGVFRRAVCDHWVICVPCSESLDGYELNQHNLFTHVLIPSDELPETHFRTLSELEVRVFDKLVKLKDADNVPVLFSEVFYADDVRYEVFCLERPLNRSSRNTKFKPRLYSVKNMKDCMDLLMCEKDDESVIMQLDEILKQFLFLSSKHYFSHTVDQQVVFVKGIYDRCLQMVQRDKNTGGKFSNNRIFTENVQIAVESYVLHNMYSIIMKGLITNLTTEIGAFNKTLRGLASIQLQHLNVVDTMLDSISTARNELSHFNSFTTVLGKLSCLKRCINLLTNRSADKLSLDEMLPILVFFVVKSGITTWIAQLTYVKEFSFSQTNHNHANESSFLVTTLEAIITFIRSGAFYQSIYAIDPVLKIPDAEPHCGAYICPKNRLFWKTKNAALLKLFQYIYHNNLIGAAALLDEQTQKEDTTAAMAAEPSYCHPLCSCDRCERLFANSSQVAPLTANATNDTGHSAMHVAACYGRCAIVDWLVGCGVAPHCFDLIGSTPLHCAAAHGHQKTVLLLMYAGARLDHADDDGNCPLHLASANGHADCVKALLYFAEQGAVPLDVNTANRDGETALHLAVKYYQKEVVAILLNYKANPLVRNRHENTAFDLTTSIDVRTMLTERNDAVNPLGVPKRLSDVAAVDVPSYPAQVVKVASQLFVAARHNDVETLKRCLGFGTGERQVAAAAAAATATTTKTDVEEHPLLAYMCHPLCQCEKCLYVAAGRSLTAEDDDDLAADLEVFGVNVDIRDEDGFTALHIACKYGSVEAALFLMDVGASINAETYEQLLTPLHVACVQNQLATVKALAERGRPHHLNRLTAMHALGERGRQCRLDAQDRSGNTALHYACMAGNRSMVELLLEYGPSLKVRNDRGRTPLDEAEECLSYPVICMLRSSMATADEEQSW